jgi:hypothetical protein
MASNLVRFLSARPDSAAFLLPSELGRSVEELFAREEWLLPQPYKIFPADETQPPILGFPVAESAALRDLDARLDRWLTDEVQWQISRTAAQAKEKAQLALSAYLGQLAKLAENAMLANLLNDYHAVFWLAHSFDLARQFSSVPRRVSAVDTNIGRTQGDALKYRIFSKWVVETRELLNGVATRCAPILDGEEQRALRFFRLLQDDVLILTEEFIGPDLRELRSFLTGYLRRDFQSFRDSFERLRTVAGDLLQNDRTFRAALPLFSAAPDQGITTALLVDPRFQAFVFDMPAVQNAVSREDREYFQLIARRLREFGVLNTLRRGIIWMMTLPDGHVVSADKRSSMAYAYSRSTRPLDFGRPGVIDPMVHRFGLIYDISSFTETLGNIQRGGRREEVASYRQMLVFQRKMESIAERHLLQFEKFLGDGAFYTTRRALRLLRAAVEIQRFYADMRRKGFAFNKGLRIALNFGYYRLLPMKSGPDPNERITEFYGPGIVELSRLTTGKANKEIEEFASFLITHGYDQSKVQNFFAPLARGVDVIDHMQHAREFYAYVNANGHLVNEGIVASMSLLQELSGELAGESQQLLRLRAPFGAYVGFAPAIDGVEYLGVRLIGMVSLKGLEKVEIGEIVPFGPGEAEATPLEAGESLVIVLRQELHAREEVPPITALPDDVGDSTTERLVPQEIVICVKTVADADDEVLIGEWDPVSDDVRNPLRIPQGDFQRLFSLRDGITAESLAERRDDVRETYHKLSDRTSSPPLPFGEFRTSGDYEAFVLGNEVEKL